MVENGQYTRTNSQSRKELAAALLRYYGLDEHEYSCYIFPSGMSAISCLLSTFLSTFTGPNKRYLVGDELYSDTTRFLNGLVATNRLQGYDTEVKEGVKYNLAFFESCSNPSGHFPHYSLLNLLHQRTDMIRIIDNTWLSGCSFNPFHHGADIVIESMSKYLSDSKCISGMVIAKRVYADEIFGFIRSYGLHVTAETCQKILTTIGSVDQRVAQSSHKTQQVLEQLKGQQIIYPSIDQRSINQRSIDQRPMKYPPSIFVIYISLLPKHFPSLNLYKIKEQLSQLVPRYGLHYETSFGSAHHRIDSYPKIILLDYTKVLVLRVYVGYEQPIEPLVKFLQDIST